MSEALAPVIHRSVWLPGVLLLTFGTLMLAFGIGWSAVEVASEMRSGIETGGTEPGYRIVGVACGVLLAGLLASALLGRLNGEERALVAIDLKQPMVGFRGRRLSADRWRVEARTRSSRARRSPRWSRTASCARSGFATSDSNRRADRTDLGLSGRHALSLARHPAL